MANRMAVGSTPQITIEHIEGDLQLVGWDNEEILVKADDAQDVTLQQEDETITLSCKDDLSLNVPKAASVQVKAVNGDMSMRGLAGEVEVDTINGDVSIRDVGSISLGSVESDFSLRGAKGDVHVKSVGGDASLREVDGSLTLDSVSDDLAVRGVGGNLKVDVDEDVVIRLEPKPGQAYAVTAGDDILLVMPAEVNATLTMSGESIKVDWPDVQTDDSTTRVLTLGDGSAQIKLDAGGDVVVTSRQDAAETADEYGNFAGMMFDWGGFGRDLGERISRRAVEAAERAARKAEQAGRRAERHARVIERKARHGAHVHAKVGRWNWDFASGKPVPPAPSAPSAPPVSLVSDEERLTVLRMLADKKISAEQAEKLLSALEGGK